MVSLLPVQTRRNAILTCNLSDMLSSILVSVPGQVNTFNFKLAAIFKHLFNGSTASSNLKD